MTDGPHAVRWAQRYIAHAFTMQYSKWHWTNDSSMTLCGRPIQIINEAAAMLPETRDDKKKVTCRQCRLRLELEKS